jgi:hypothetical protein
MIKYDLPNWDSNDKVSKLPGCNGNDNVVNIIDLVAIPITMY